MSEANLRSEQGGVSPILKLDTQGKTKTPPKSNFMGVIALAFCDPRSSRGPQRLPESAI